MLAYSLRLMQNTNAKTRSIFHTANVKREPFCRNMLILRLGDRYATSTDARPFAIALEKRESATCKDKHTGYGSASLSGGLC